MRIRLGFALAATVAAVMPALAADLPEPPVIEPTPPIVYEEPDMGGWYIRGDVDYHITKFKGADYITYGPPAGTNTFTTGSIANSWSAGGGIGYKVNKYFRVDATADYLLRSSFTGSTSGTCGGAPCTSTDTSTFEALVLMANAYADLGTYNGFTPYVGVGIGGAKVHWSTLANDIGGSITYHVGANNWRFAYAAMVGVSYCLTDKVDVDVGYRYTHITGGRMFQLDSGGGAGPGFDRGMDNHEIRAGLRYNFGKRKGCREVAYVPEPGPTPIYKN